MLSKFLALRVKFLSIQSGPATHPQRKQRLVLVGLILAGMLGLFFWSVGRVLADSPNLVAYVVNTNSDTVSVIALSTDTVIATIPVGDGPGRVVFTPNGAKAYVTNSNSNNVSVINAASHTVVATLTVGTSPRDLAVTPDGTRVYVTNAISKTVSVIDTTTDTVVTTLPLSNPSAVPIGAACVPDGSEIWIGVGGGTNLIQMYTYPGQADAGAISSVIGAAEWTDFLPDSSYAFVNNGCGCCGNLQKISTASNSVISTLSFNGSGAGLAIAPDGSAVYAGTAGHCGGGGPQVKKVDPATNTAIDSVPLPTTSGGMAVTPNGAFLYVALPGTTDRVYKINTASLTVITPITVGDDPSDVAIAAVPAPTRVYLPVILRAYRPPIKFSIKNETGGILAYSVSGTPQGTITCQNIPGGATVFCGQFTSGVYQATASSTGPGCGLPATAPLEFPAGVCTRIVRCGAPSIWQCN